MITPFAEHTEHFGKHELSLFDLLNLLKHAIMPAPKTKPHIEY